MSDSYSLSHENSKSFITNQYGDSYLYTVNRNVFDSIGSKQAFKYHYGNKIFVENRLYVIVGSDSGLLIEYLIERELPDGSRYIFVEPKDIYQLLLSKFNNLEDNKQIFLFTEQDWQRQEKIPFFSAYAYLDAVIPIKSFAVEDGFLVAYRKLWQDIKMTLTTSLWKLNTQYGNCIFTQRQIENLAENRHPASCLANSFPGYTAVILAGGPSLDDVLPWIKDNRDNLVVFAVSRICNRLLQVNITPDIVVSVDPHPVSFDVSKHMLNMPDSVIFVHNNHVTPLLLGQWPWRSLYMDYRYPWNTQLDTGNIHGIGPTVSNGAINLALEMGFSQIILAGLDLCCSREGYSHAKGSDERDIGAIIRFSGRTVKTNGGWFADTDDVFINSIHAIKGQAENARSNNCTLINPCPSAAAIENITHTELGNIRLKSLTESTHAILNKYLPADDRKTRINHYNSVLKELHPVHYKLKKIVSLAKQAIEYNEGLFGRNGKKADFKFKIKMDNIEKRLNSDFGDLSNLSKIFGMAEFVKVFNTEEAQDWQDSDVEQTGLAYYEAYIAGATRLCQLISEAIERVNSRIDEESEQPDLNRLCNQWIKDKQPGRIYVFKNRQLDPNGLKDSLEIHRVKELENLFHTELALKDHGYMPEIRHNANLTGVAGKANEHFQNQDQEALLRMLQGLKTRKEDHVKPLYNLVKGYYCELIGNTDEAVENYVKVENHSAMEDALIRITIISLERNDIDNALSSLQIQTTLSFTYMPQYAQLLAIAGQYQNAIDIYTEYLSKVPSDLATMMKLGLLYQSLQQKEGALWVFQYIMDQDPNNETASKIYRQLKSA